MAWRTTIFALFVAALVSSVVGKECSHDGPCVQYYYGSCEEGGIIDGYTPTCAGNCFQYNAFYAVAAYGNGFTLGTNCYVYSDINCQDYIGETGNQVSSNCVDFPLGALSMQCYYNCHH